jgi:hypothetical protein
MMTLSKTKSKRSSAESFFASSRSWMITLHQGVHQTNTDTNTAMPITGANLNGYAPAPPSKKPRESWIWKHGEALIRDSDYSLVWLCTICHAENVHHPHKDYILAAASTTPARRHMERHGFDLKGQQMHRGLKRRAGSLLDYVDRQNTADRSTFNEKGWIDAFVRWAVTTNQSLRQVSSQPQLFLLTFQQPRLENLIPTSANTIRDWIIQAASSAKEKIEKSLSQATSSITISFDNWTADNGLDFLGVTPHYLDASLCPRAVLLGLCDTRGSHSCESIAEEVLRVINDYDVTEKVQYFMADNATANDRAIRVLSGCLDVDPEHDRLRCGAHVINLVAKAVLYGTDNDAIDPDEREECLLDSCHIAALEAVVRSEPAEEALQTWRRKGPVGKLHNLVTHIQKTPKRQRFFEMKQNFDSDSDDGRIYRVIVNGGVRWNSSCDMIERAMNLRDALELYHTPFRSLSDSDRLSSSDCLDAADWSELERLLDVLSPLKHASLRLQADNDAKHAFWEQLATFDSLLGEFERLKGDTDTNPAAISKHVSTSDGRSSTSITDCRTRPPRTGWRFSSIHT